MGGLLTVLTVAGSGGGWQVLFHFCLWKCPCFICKEKKKDSGGVWPGLKEILGVSGSLLPRHEPILASAEMLRRSLIVCHAGMASNVGPVLELVTEKYLLRLDREERRQARSNYDAVLSLLHRGDDAALPELGKILTQNFLGPVQSIVPQVLVLLVLRKTCLTTYKAHNAYTQRLLELAPSIPGYLGFVMHGGLCFVFVFSPPKKELWLTRLDFPGISGGGCGFMFEPSKRDAAVPLLLRLLRDTKRSLQHAIPFAMDPVVYDFSVNNQGTVASQVSVVPQLTELSRKAEKESSMQLLNVVIDEDMQKQPQNQVASCLISNVTHVPIAHLSPHVLVDDDSVGVVVLAGGLGTRW